MKIYFFHDVVRTNECHSRNFSSMKTQLKFFIAGSKKTQGDWKDKKDHKSNAFHFHSMLIALEQISVQQMIMSPREKDTCEVIG